MLQNVYNLRHISEMRYKVHFVNIFIGDTQLSSTEKYGT
jgi:hypothetical protein